MNLRLGRGEQWAIVAAISYTVVNITLRAAAVHIDPYIGSALRQIPVALLAFGAILVTRRWEFLPSHARFIGWRFVLALLAGGFLSFFVGNVLYFLGLAEGGLGITVSASQAGVVFAGLGLGLLFLREQPRREQWIGSAIIAGGLVLVGYAQLGAPRELWWLGLLFAFLAGSCYASTNVLTRLVQRERPVLFITLAGTSIGGMVPLLVVIAFQAATSGGAAFRTLDWWTVGVVILAGVANAVALVGLTQAMRDATVATTNTISSAQLVFSFIGAVLLFNETGSPPMILGVVLVTAGIVFAQLDRAARNGRRAPSPPAGPVEAEPALVLPPERERPDGWPRR